MAKPLMFEPRARLMLLLGDQLIRDAGIAVFELVKNAYDADSRTCSITLEDITDNDNARIVVEDTGEGMDLDTIKNVWLSPGTRNRLTQREGLIDDPKKLARSRLGRLPLGEKGVGRFAVHKLGQSVTLITRKAKCEEVVVTIDWTDFDSDLPLSTVSVRAIERTPEHFKGLKSGTRIEITNLRDMPWTRRRIRDLHRAINSICSPFSGPDEFVPTLTLSPDPGWLEGLLTSEDAMELALFRFMGRIEDGELRYDYEFRPWPSMKGIRKRTLRDQKIPLPIPDSAKDDADDSEPETSANEVSTDIRDYKIGPIDISLLVFDRDRDVLKLVPGNMNLVKEFLDNNGGVRVYRNGVRVYDFGESGNDWLDLGGRRINVPTRRIGNNQVIGEVALDLAQSTDLKEKTNREGFVESDAYIAFKTAVKFAFVQAEAERNVDKKAIRDAASDKPRNKEPVISEINEMKGEIVQLELAPEKTKKLGQYLDRIADQYQEMMERLLTAAGAGLNLSVVMHEVEKGIRSLYKAIQQNESHDNILDRAKHLADIIDSLTWLTRQSGVSDVSAADLIQHCLFAWSYRFTNHSIEVVNGLTAGDPDFTIRGTRRLLMTALMNLVDNSIYWTSAKRKHNRKIYVGTTFELTGNPAFVVADNGPGLRDPADVLTTPFFTRKADGMGLGLHIADEIMKMHEGRIVFPQTGDISLPKEFDGAVIMLQFGGAK